MAEPIRIELINHGSGEPDELDRLTRMLSARLRDVDGVEVQLQTRPAPAGSKMVGEIAIALLVGLTAEFTKELAGHVGKRAASRGRLAVEKIANIVRPIILEWRQHGLPFSAKVAPASGPPVVIDGRSDADRAKGDVTTKGDALPDAKTKYAILIGSGTFEANSGIENLRYTRDDVQEMEKLLLSYPNDFARETVSTVVDRPHYEVEGQISDALRAAKGSHLLIYYSGHGKVSGTNGDLYLTAANSNSDRLSTTAVKFLKIIELINDSAVRSVGILLDSCFAGSAMSSLQIAKGQLQDQLAAVVQSAGRELYFIGASLATQVATESPKDGLSAMTKVLIEGVRSGRADIGRRGEISFDDLYDYLSLELGGVANQTPVRAVKASGKSPIFLHAGRLLAMSPEEEIKAIADAVFAVRKTLPNEIYEYIIFRYLPAAKFSLVDLRGEDRYQALLSFSRGRLDATDLVRLFDPIKAQPDPVAAGPFEGPKIPGIWPGWRIAALVAVPLLGLAVWLGSKVDSCWFSSGRGASCQQVVPNRGQPGVVVAANDHPAVAQAIQANPSKPPPAVAVPAPTPPPLSPTAAQDQEVDRLLSANPFDSAASSAVLDAWGRLDEAFWRVIAANPAPSSARQARALQSFRDAVPRYDRIAARNLGQLPGFLNQERCARIFDLLGSNDAQVRDQASLFVRKIPLDYFDRLFGVKLAQAGGLPAAERQRIAEAASWFYYNRIITISGSSMLSLVGRRDGVRDAFNAGSGWTTDAVYADTGRSGKRFLAMLLYAKGYVEREHELSPDLGKQSWRTMIETLAATSEDYPFPATYTQVAKALAAGMATVGSNDPAVKDVLNAIGSMTELGRDTFMQNDPGFASARYQLFSAPDPAPPSVKKLIGEITTKQGVRILLSSGDWFFVHGPSHIGWISRK